MHHRAEPRIRVPSRARRANSCRPRIRAIKPRAGRGPWRDGSSARCGRLGCSCGHGTRAFSPGGGCWVGMYASRRPPRRPGRHRTGRVQRSSRRLVARRCHATRPDKATGPDPFAATDREMHIEPLLGGSSDAVAPRFRASCDRARLQRLPERRRGCPHLWTTVWNNDVAASRSFPGGSSE